MRTAWRRLPSGSGPAPGLSTSVSEGVIALTISDYPHEWWYEIDWDGCQKVSSGASVEVSGYENRGGDTLDIYAYSASQCYSFLDETSVTLAPPSLSASVSVGAVSITLSNHYSDWWFTLDNGSCAQASGSEVGNIRGYPRTYAYTLSISAYSDGACQSALDSATLDMPAISLSSSVSDGKVDLTLSNYGMDWEFRIGWGTCTSVSGDTVSGIAGYQSGTYSVKAYRNGSGCGDELGATSFTIP